MPLTTYHALEHYIDLLLDAICAVDRNGNFEFLSRGAERIFGYPAAEMLGRSMLDFIHPDDLDRTLKVAQAINEGLINLDFENRYIRKDGSVVYLLWSARWSADKQQRVAVARDITKLKLIEARQQALIAISEAAFSAENLSELYQQLELIIGQFMPIDGFIIARPDSTNTVNFAYQHLPQNTDVPLIQSLCSQLIAASHSIETVVDNNWLAVPLRSHDSLMGVLAVHLCATTSKAEAEDAALLTFVGKHIAVTIERKELLARLQQQAMYDDLTLLPKRALFYERCHQALVDMQRNAVNFAICYIDLDGFKPVNDQYGHAIGDLLLQQIATQLRQSVRKTDTVARLGGDEFAVLLTQISDTKMAATIAEKMREKLSLSFSLQQHTVNVTPSIGITFCENATNSVEQLISLADKGMYQAKQAGGNCCILFS